MKNVEMCRKALCKLRKRSVVFLNAKRACEKVCGKCGKLVLFNKYFEVLNKTHKDSFSIFFDKMFQSEVGKFLLRKQEKQEVIMLFLQKKLEKFSSVSHAKRYV